jgi:hypothetical protein
MEALSGVDELIIISSGNSQASGLDPIAHSEIPVLLCSELNRLMPVGLACRPRPDATRPGNGRDFCPLLLVVMPPLVLFGIAIIPLFEDCGRPRGPI